VSIKDEVRASAAAHGDLGPGYDAAVAEGLVERIGEEIDKRVDARLYGQPPYAGPYPGPPSPPPRLRPRREPVPGRVGIGAVAMALGSIGLAIGATAVVLHPGGSNGVSGGQGLLVVLIWIVIAVINVSYSRHR
jgi:hypothetical protein